MTERLESDGVESWYEFAAQGTLKKFFDGVPAIKAVVPVRGYAKGWNVKFEEIAA